MVVVDLPKGLELTGETGKQINDEFAEAVAKPSTDAVLTLLNVENPLSSGVFDEVKRGAAMAEQSGIDRWAIVVTQRVKGMAFDSSLDELDTHVFESESEAREWVNG
ncbi:hypothetical protein OB905_08760 [Halobacteria archaeon AArc-dxtr1]|nr:hypothetical protein [Halobacteria archaeon AArc-dxtr1]